MRKPVMILLFTWLLSICALAIPAQCQALTLSVSLAGEREPYAQKRDPFVSPTLGGAEKKQLTKENDSSRKVQKAPLKEKEKRNREQAATRKNPPPAIVLTGIVVGEEGNRAILFDSERRVSHVVMAGMKMGNYLVTTIAPGLVVMKDDSRTLRLLIGSKN